MLRSDARPDILSPNALLPDGAHICRLELSWSRLVAVTPRLSYPSSPAKFVSAWILSLRCSARVSNHLKSYEKEESLTMEKYCIQYETMNGWDSSKTEVYDASKILGKNREIVQLRYEERLD